MTLRLLLFFLILPVLSFSQVLKGKVLDAVTNQPLESVAIYFDNTTIGTTTNEKGEFSINYSDAIRSSLVVSYLGYEQVLINDYRGRTDILLNLVESLNSLDEVFIAGDALSRKQKMHLFEKQFLGKTKRAKSCEILNKDAIILKYDKKTKTLYASSSAPIRVLNKNLQYEIVFDIVDFEINFTDVDPKINKFDMYSISYTGKTFFKELEGSTRNKIIKNREAAYKGSVQHFLRALYNESLTENGYTIGRRRVKINPYDIFIIRGINEDDYKTISFKDRISVYYKGGKRSDIQNTLSQFQVNRYGNYIPSKSLLFEGHMANLRVGDMLPMDYGLYNNWF